MKWAIVAACLTCADDAPRTIAVLENESLATCHELAQMALNYALIGGEPGTLAAAWCVPIDDWQVDDDYPQGKR